MSYQRPVHQRQGLYHPTLQDLNKPYARAFEINDGEILEVEIVNS